MDIPVIPKDQAERDFRSFLVNEKSYTNSTIREIMKYYRRINRNNITDEDLKTKPDCFSCGVWYKIRWILKIYNEYQSKKNLKDKI